MCPMRNMKILFAAVLFMCGMSIWGCNQQKSGAINSKIRDLEVRYTKLEEDYQTLLTNSESDRRKVQQLEEQRASLEADKLELSRQVESASAEREALRRQVNQRISERDAAQNQLVELSKDLQALAGRINDAVNATKTNPSIIPALR